MLKLPGDISKIFPQKDKFIGLDIGSSSIKLAQFVLREGKPSLNTLKIAEIDLRKDRHQAQLEALREVFRDVATANARVNVTLNCPQSCTRILTIPFMPKSEIPQTLKWQMRNFVPFNIEGAMLDYQLLREITEKGAKRFRLAVACSPQETINGNIALLSEAGITPNLFTQAGFALGNIIDNLLGEENKTQAILDIGYNFSELFIFQDKKIAFNRKLPVAGQNFTQDMTQVLVSDIGKTELSPQQAEDIKRKYGIPAAATPEVLAGKLSAAQLVSLLRPNLEKLAEEIERSFNFYLEKEQGTKVEGLILLGGGSNLKGLVKNLTEQLEIPVEIGNPLQGLSLKESALFKEKVTFPHRFAQAVGAALSPPATVNLLPVEIKGKTRILIERSTIKALIAATIVILILVYRGMKIRLGVYDKRIAAARLELKALAVQAQDAQKRVLLANVLQERTYFSDALMEISNRIPERIRLTEMELREKILTLKGKIKSVTLAEQKILTEFIRALEQGIFKEVTLVSTQEGRGRDRLFTFELRLILE